MGKTNKRISGRGIANRCTRTQDLFGEGGGTAEQPYTPAGGGGYQDKCSILNFGHPQKTAKKIDPRIEELRQMGLQAVWIDIAEDIGIDAFMRVWMILDADTTNIGDDGRIFVPIRSFKTYQRFQRNRYIEALDAIGKTPKEIKEILTSELCEVISLRHILRLIKK